MKEGLVCKGDFIVIPKGSLHYIENVEDDDLVIWYICVPAFTLKVQNSKKIDLAHLYE